MANHDAQNLLLKAISCHQNGDLKQAYDLYQKVRKIDPNNPDALHNSGLIALAINKNSEAEIFFKKAIQSNSKFTQYWVSLAQLLYDLDKYKELTSLLVLAKSRDVQHPVLDNLSSEIPANSQSPNEQSEKNNLQNTLSQSAEYLKNGKLVEAASSIDVLYRDYQSSYEVALLRSEIYRKLNQYEIAKQALQRAISLRPDQPIPYINLGFILNESGKHNDAIKLLEKALMLDANSYLSLNNLANAHESLAQFEKAIHYYEQVIALQPSLSEVHYNLGTVYRKIGNPELSIKSLLESIKLNHNFAPAFNNLANSYRELGEIELSIQNYKHAIHLDPNLYGSLLNLVTLCVQLNRHNSSLSENDFYIKLNNHISQASPKASLVSAIYEYKFQNFEKCLNYLKIYESFEAVDFNALDLKDHKFCSGYYSFIKKLADQENFPQIKDAATVYHLGDSHCLSFAGNTVKIDSDTYKIKPLVTFGAKAFHLSAKRKNEFKGITSSNFLSLKKKSIVFLSFGEIDNRPDEGFISAHKKTHSPYDVIIEDTVRGYVDFFADLNKVKKHILFFFTVPAPIFRENINSETNRQLLENIKLFNSVLTAYCKLNNFKVIDIYSVTTTERGFSDGRYHIDHIHLGSHALEELQSFISYDETT